MQPEDRRKERSSRNGECLLFESPFLCSVVLMPRSFAELYSLRANYFFSQAVLGRWWALGTKNALLNRAGFKPMMNNPYEAD